jgi:outer membrane protein TolC
VIKKILTILFILIARIYASNALDVVNYKWWVSFDDANLSKYINISLKNNSSIKIAKLKLEEYNEYVKLSFGLELPAITSSISGFELQNSPIPSMLIKESGTVMPLMIGYELDIFGKNRDKTKANKKMVEAYQYQLQSIYLSLVSNLASVYFNVSQVNKVIELQTELLAIKNNILNNLTIKKNLVSNIEINNAMQEVENVKIEIKKLQKLRVQLLTQLSILLGDNPNDFNDLTITDFDMLKLKPIREVSSHVIFMRPEIKAYEKQLEKYDIDISIARKEFLPTITLSGGIIFNNLNGGFFNLKNTIFNILGSVSGDLFTGGRKVTNLNIKKNKYKQMFEEYRNITLQITKEVNDSMYNVIYSNNILDSNQQKVNLERQNIKHYNNMLRNGLITETNLKELKQKLIALEIENVNLKTEMLINHITLYKATGGSL